jgi:hypothetical protein
LLISFSDQNGKKFWIENSRKRLLLWFEGLEVSESQISVSDRNRDSENQNANERILNQMDDIRPVLKFDGESRIECCPGF